MLSPGKEEKRKRGRRRGWWCLHNKIHWTCLFVCSCTAACALVIQTNPFLSSQQNKLEILFMHGPNKSFPVSSELERLLGFRSCDNVMKKVVFLTDYIYWTLNIDSTFTKKLHWCLSGNSFLQPQDHCLSLQAVLLEGALPLWNVVSKDQLLRIAVQQKGCTNLLHLCWWIHLLNNQGRFKFH